MSFTSKATATTIDLIPVAKRDLKKTLAKLPKTAAAWLRATGFDAASGEVGLIPSRDGKLSRVVVGLGNGATLWAFSSAATSLPKGSYRLTGDLGVEAATAVTLGWGLAQYRYSRYKKHRAHGARLVWPDAVNRREVEAMLAGVVLGRDLINTPAGDLGPAELADAVAELALAHEAKCKVIKGDALVKENFPAIHAVGRAATSARAPRLIDMHWGQQGHALLTLVGKGVVFDSGGLDLKSAAGMRLMKKDMGGAAAVLALAKMVMDADLPVRLRVLIPAVENAVSADAFRPGDVLDTRKGTTVEVGNTDAEGRLVLCDALFEAASDKPDLIIDFATLTGAARVALGHDLPAMFTSRDETAAAINDASEPFDPDPMWRMPLFKPYRSTLNSSIADISNTDNVGRGGAITAALFLQDFVGNRDWIHIDTMGWNMRTRPGRPAGGEVLGVRTLYRMLKNRYVSA